MKKQNNYCILLIHTAIESRTKKKMARKIRQRKKSNRMEETERKKSVEKMKDVRQRERRKDRKEGVSGRARRRGNEVEEQW